METFDTEEKILHDRFVELGGPTPSNCKKQVREARKRIKKEMSKHRRLKDKNDTRRLLKDAGY